jgi:hypothetical protein
MIAIFATSDHLLLVHVLAQSLHAETTVYRRDCRTHSYRERTHVAAAIARDLVVRVQSCSQSPRAHQW